MSQIKKATTETLRAKLKEAFYLASSKFEISYQRLAIRKIVVEKEDIFVNLPKGSGKSSGRGVGRAKL